MIEQRLSEAEVIELADMGAFVRQPIRSLPYVQMLARDLLELRQTVRAMLAARPQRYSGGVRAYNDAIAQLQVLVQEAQP